ncbi:tape measure protein [Frankia sp. RB7]|nr:tape measure protein [Frankia sp. RB7]
MATINDALVVQLSADIKGLQASLSQAQASVRSFRADAETQITGLTNVMGPLKAAFLGFVSVYAAFEAGKEIVDAGMQMQALQNRMVAATGDVKVAADAMAFARAESERLGLSFQTVAGSFASFSASALRSGLNLKQTKDIFSSVAEASTALHLSTEQSASAFLALEQMASKGTVQMQELKLQLAQAIPGAFEIMAKSMGVSVGQLNEMMSKGQVLATDVLPKFGEELHREFGDRAVVSADSAQAAFNRFNNAIFDLKANLAGGGFLDTVTEATKRLTNLLNDPETKQGLKDFATLLGEIAEVALKAAAAIGEFFATASQRKEAMLSLTAQGKAVTPDAIKDQMAILQEQDKLGSTKLSAEQVAAITGGPASPSSPAKSTDDYTLGKVTPFNPNADKEARSRSAALTKVENVEKTSGDDLDKLRIQYDQQQKILEDALKKHAITQKRFNEDMVALQQEYGKKIHEVLAKQFDDGEEAENDDYKMRQKELQKMLDAKMITLDKYHKLEQKLERDHEDKLRDIRNKARQAELTDREKGWQGLLGIQITYQEKSIEEEGASFMQSLQMGAQHSQALFELAKVAAIAKALLSARQSVVDAYAWGMSIGGPPAAWAAAGIAAAAQAANIAAIASTSFGGGGGVSGAGGGSVSATDTSTSNQQAATPVAQPTTVIVNLLGKGRYSGQEIRDIIDGINDQVSNGYIIQVT